MEAETRGAGSPPPPRTGHRLSIFDCMLLIAALALGFWLIADDLKGGGGERLELAVLVVVIVLGSISLVGPILLLAERRRGAQKTWRAGRILWFSQGMASWLLWPPAVYNRFQGKKFGDSTSAVCYYYGTPLMAIYVTTALLAGGWFRKRRRRYCSRDWREQLGLILGLLWACTGLYILSLLYREDFGR